MEIHPVIYVFFIFRSVGMSNNLCSALVPILVFSWLHYTIHVNIAKRIPNHYRDGCVCVKWAGSSSPLTCTSHMSCPKDKWSWQEAKSGNKGRTERSQLLDGRTRGKQKTGGFRHSRMGLPRLLVLFVESHMPLLCSKHHPYLIRPSQSCGKKDAGNSSAPPHYYFPSTQTVSTKYFSLS